MNTFDNVKIKAKNFLCFGEDGISLEEIKPINIIIGRNNSGKSSLLEVINYCCDNYKKDQNFNHNEANSEVIVSVSLKDIDISSVFLKTTSGGPINGNHYAFGSQFIGKQFDFRIEIDRTHKFSSLQSDFNDLKTLNEYFQKLATIIKNPFSTKKFLHLNSERDIVPELENDKLIDSSGGGITNTISNILNHKGAKTELVSEKLLEELNKIFDPDIIFTLIDTQKDKTDSKWEVFLEEEKKGSIPLSRSGSGLKTVLSVLAFLFLIPHSEKKQPENYIYGFEELENNLHPAIQRKLFLYLKDFALKNNTIFFITTHSNVVIDLFSNDKNAQIIHIKHDGQSSRINKAVTFVEHNGILDDLDIRASDLLQSNCLVWVEGPSDRLYFNKWIELYSRGELVESAHYQCIFYGGRLLYHLTARQSLEKVNEFLNILRVNRKCILIMDGDQKKKKARYNSTKQRIRKEITDIKGLCWITKGREIENYLNNEIIAPVYCREGLRPLGQFEKIKDYLNDIIGNSEGDNFQNKKVLFAEKFIEHMNVDKLRNNLDLNSKMDEVIAFIKQCNNMKE